jgi:hypothetical protein
MPDVGTGTITCRFCGLGHDPSSAVRVTSSRVVVPSHVGLVGVVLVGALIIAILGVAGAMVFWAGRLASTVTKGVATAMATPKREAGVATISGLGSMTLGRHALDAAPPAGGYGAFDAMAQVPWAMTIAQGWAQDARLERIDVNRVRPDGSVNLADDADASVRYRFYSPHAAKVLLARRQTSARATAITALWVDVANGRPSAMAIEDDSQRFAARELIRHPEALPLAQLIPTLQRAGRYRAPFLKGYLIHLDGEGWVWYFSPLSGDQLPRVRASDAKPWPYRR